LFLLITHRTKAQGEELLGALTSPSHFLFYMNYNNKEKEMRGKRVSKVEARQPNKIIKITKGMQEK